MAYRWRLQTEEAVSDASQNLSETQSESPAAHFCCEHFAEVSDQLDRLENLLKAAPEAKFDHEDISYRLGRIEQLLDKLCGKQEIFEEFLNHISLVQKSLSNAKFTCNCGCVCKLGEAELLATQVDNNNDICLSLVKNLRTKIGTHMTPTSDTKLNQTEVAKENRTDTPTYANPHESRSIHMPIGTHTTPTYDPILTSTEVTKENRTDTPKYAKSIDTKWLTEAKENRTDTPKYANSVDTKWLTEVRRRTATDGNYYRWMSESDVKETFHRSNVSIAESVTPTETSFNQPYQSKSLSRSSVNFAPTGHDLYRRFADLRVTHSLGQLHSADSTETEEKKAEMTEYSTLMCITANVGSLFDEPDLLMGRWVREVGKSIAEVKADFVALHLQELGGKKSFAAGVKLSGEDLAKKLLEQPGLEDFSTALGFFDEDYKNKEKFTGLGCIYLIHKPDSVKLFDFKNHSYLQLEKDEYHGGDLKNVTTVQKGKYPKDLYGDRNSARKGFMRVKFSINGKDFNFVNLQNFNDLSNFGATTEFPTEYATHRREALDYIIQHLGPDFQEEAFFLAGDFNTRLDQHSLITEFGKTRDAVPEHEKDDSDNIVKTVFRAFGTGNKVVSVEDRKFDLHDMHEWVFSSCNGQLVRKHDKELRTIEVDHHLHEPNIIFPPSFPYDWEGKNPSHFHRKSCPAWTDRVVANGPAWSSLKYDSYSSSSTIYNMIGGDENMGLHKPVYLYGTVACARKPVEQNGE